MNIESSRPVPARSLPEEQLADRFRAFGATCPETAQDIVPADAEEARSLDSLRAQGIVRGAASGFYLDEDALEARDRRRRGWVYAGAGAAVIAALIGFRATASRG